MVSSTDGLVGKTPAKSSEPVEVGEPRNSKLMLANQGSVAGPTPREALAKAGARLATSGIGRGRLAYNANNNSIAPAVVEWPGAGAHRRSHEGGLPVDVRGRYATIH